MELLTIQIPWIEILWISIGAIFVIMGLIGCIVPIIPGPPLSFIGLLMLQLKEHSPFTLSFMIILGTIVLAITIIDYVMPFWSAKYFSSSKLAIRLSMLGLLFGMFIFPPWGFIIGSILGAIIGELVIGKKEIQIFKSSFATVLGFVVSTIIKVLLSGYMFWLFIINIY